MIAPLRGRTPVVPASVFVAPTAVVVGDVVLGEEASVWYGSVLRGDVGPIVIGDRTNIQDGCILHTTAGRSGLTVGREVTAGHRAVLHGATIHDRCLIGMGAIVLDDAEIGEESLIAAGCLVRERMVVPPRSFVAGVPGVLRGPIPSAVLRRLRESAEHYVKLAREHAEIRGAR